MVKLENWSDTWLLKFYPVKGKHMNIHRTPKEDEVKYKLLGQEISKVEELSFDKHICEKVNKANSIFAAL